MARFYIQKSNGEKEYFQDKKLQGSLLKSFIAEKDAKVFVREIKKEIPQDATSEQVRQITYNYLCKAHLPNAQLYNLRKSLADLPPLVFEQFIKKLLEVDGYSCEWEKIIKGAGTEHEVDVVAKKDTHCFLIECKRRRNWHKPTGLGKVLIVRARFEDILDGYRKGFNNYQFSRAWVVNNAKFSRHAIDYASHRGIWLTGWGHPRGKGINEWIQHLQVYPVTMLRLKKIELDKLLSAEIITFKDVGGEQQALVERMMGQLLYRRIEKQIQGIEQCTI